MGALVASEDRSSCGCVVDETYQGRSEDAQVPPVEPAGKVLMEGVSSRSGSTRSFRAEA